MKVVAIVQARMNSSRLPGKVMLNLNGRTVLSHVLERVKAIPSVDEVIVATTTGKQDRVLCDEALRSGCSYYCGSEDDVLERYYQAATIAEADIVVRITSDCPLLDPEISDNVIKYHLNSGSDYTSNTKVRSYPRGLDVEVFAYRALKQAFELTKEAAQREHVTPYIYGHPELFTIGSYSQDIDYSSYRWTLDTPEDWILIEAIYKELYQAGSLFPFEKIIAFLGDNPALLKINSHIEQKKIGH
jgi:spore coat polysaccharide biosynthesis protein SpsF